MITLKGFALIVELTVAVWFIAALAGFRISRSKSWLVSFAVAVIAVLAAVTMLIDSST
jgi:hypothetical protein